MSLPLVLVPGMMCDARLFGPQVGALSHARAILCAPLLGASIEEIAQDVLAAAPPRFALAGLSMGGIVAMEVLRRAPGRVSHLALMDTNARAESAEVAARREPQIEAVRAGRLEAVMREEMKPNYLAPGPGRGAVLDLVMEMALAQGAGAFERQSRALQSRPDAREALRGWPGPALVLCGRHDALCPVFRHEEIAGLLGDAEFLVIEAAGHLPTLEAPDAVTAAMTGWLDRPAAA